MSSKLANPPHLAEFDDGVPASATRSATVENDLFSKISATEWRVAIIALVLALVARWDALMPGAYAIDDYLLSQDDHAISLHFSISQGRELEYGLRAVLVRLGALPPHVGTLGAFLLTAVLVAVALVICRLWGIRDRLPESLLAVCLIVLHPYQSEIFTFRMTTLFLAISLAVCFAALLLCVRSKGWWALSCCLFVGALFLYQAGLNYVAMALFFAGIIHLAGMAKEDIYFAHNYRSQLALFAATVVVYATVRAAVARLSGVAIESRGAFIAVGQIGERLKVAAAKEFDIFFHGEAFLPLATKLLLAGSVAAAILLTFLGKRDTGGTQRQAGRMVLVAALIVLIGTPLCIGVILALRIWWPVPRVLVQTGMFWAGVFVLTYRLANVAGRRVLVVGFCVIVFSFIGISNHIFSDQRRVNLRDLANANRIVGRLEALPDFAHLKGVVLSGGTWTYPLPLETAEGDANISAFPVPWAKVHLLNEATGYNFQAAPADVVSRADSYCSSALKWPAPQSVTEMDSYGVVCLPTQ